MDGHFEVQGGYIGDSENGWFIDSTSITALGTSATIQIPNGTGGTGYNNANVYMSGHGTEVFSLGNTGTGNGISWNGSTLNVSGNITIGNLGDIDLSQCDNSNSSFGTGGGGDYGKFGVKLNSYDGSNYNTGECYIYGYDSDGNMAVAADPIIELPNGTEVSVCLLYTSPSPRDRG